MSNSITIIAPAFYAVDSIICDCTEGRCREFICFAMKREEIVGIEIDLKTNES